MAPANTPQSGWYTLCQCPRRLQFQALSDSSDGAVVAIASISLDASSASSPLPHLSSKACLPQLCPKPPQLCSAPAATLPSGVALSGLCVSKPCPFSFLDFLVKLQSMVHLEGRLALFHSVSYSPFPSFPVLSSAPPPHVRWQCFLRPSPPFLGPASFVLLRHGLGAMTLSPTSHNALSPSPVVPHCHWRCHVSHDGLISLHYSETQFWVGKAYSTVHSTSCVPFQLPTWPQIPKSYLTSKTCVIVSCRSCVMMMSLLNP